MVDRKKGPYCNKEIDIYYTGKGLILSRVLKEKYMKRKDRIELKRLANEGIKWVDVQHWHDYS